MLASSMKVKMGGKPAGTRREPRLLGGKDVHKGAAAALVLELDDAVDLGEQRVVLAAADVGTGEKARAALPHEDRAPGDPLAAVALDAQVLGVGVAAVAARALSFLVCHLELLLGYFSQLGLAGPARLRAL